MFTMETIDRICMRCNNELIHVWRDSQLIIKQSRTIPLSEQTVCGPEWWAQSDGLEVWLAFKVNVD